MQQACPAGAPACSATTSGRAPAPRSICALPPLGRRWHSRRSLRCNVQPGVDRGGLRPNLPAAPPARMPPPPPPPPPPPQQEVKNDLNISRRGLAAMMLGGTAAWWFAINSAVPLAGVDRERNLALLRTKGGNVVVATTDEAGRMFLFDKAGNLYYDTEDPRLGLYIVDARGDMYNKYVDKEGKVQTLLVGNIDELVSVEVGELGGVNFKDLQKEFRQAQSGRITGFFKPVDEGDASWADLMPPNAVEYMGEGAVRVPKFLEDWEVELEPRGLFGGPPEQSPAEILRTLQRDDNH